MKRTKDVKLYLHRSNCWHPDEDYIVINASIRYYYRFLYLYAHTNIGFAIVGVHLRYTPTRKRNVAYSHGLGYPRSYFGELIDVLNRQITINYFLRSRTSKATIFGKL